MRPDADPQIMRAFNDYAYLLFNGTFIISTIQAVAHGVVGLLDRSAYRVFPAWACWLAIVVGLSFCTEAVCPFVKSGPFALEGWFAGWVPGSGYFVWTIVTTAYMVKDVRRRQQALDEEARLGHAAILLGRRDGKPG